MKARTIIQIIGATILFASCSSYYQIATMSSDSVKLADSGAYSCKQGDVTVSYDFWSNCGAVSFAVTNDSDKDIVLDLGRSFFIRNGAAYDYFLNRTEIYSTGATSGRGSSATALRAVAAGVSAGAGIADGIAAAGVSAGYGTSAGLAATVTQSGSISRSHSVEYREAETVTIPAHSTKAFEEYTVANGEYARCGLVRDPGKKENASMTFTEKDSPYVVENRLMLVVDGTDVPLNNTFHVSKIRNFGEKEVLKSATATNCAGKKVSGVRQKRNVYAESDRYYVKYSLSGNEDTGRTK